MHASTKTERAAVLRWVGACFAGLLRIAWTLVRLPMLALLLALEPLVSPLLCGIAILTIVAAIFVKWTALLPHAPFWGMLGLATACMLVLIAYYAVLRVLSRS